MDDIEVDFILDAIDFVAEHGYRFLPLYHFDMNTGVWTHKVDCVCLEGFSLDDALECGGYQSRALNKGERKLLYGAFLAEAENIAAEMDEGFKPDVQEERRELEELKFFSVPEDSVCG